MGGWQHHLWKWRLQGRSQLKEEGSQKYSWGYLKGGKVKYKRIFQSGVWGCDPRWGSQLEATGELKTLNARQANLGPSMAVDCALEHTNILGSRRGWGVLESVQSLRGLSALQGRTAVQFAHCECHNPLQLQFQGTWCPLLVSAGTAHTRCTFTHPRT